MSTNTPPRKLASSSPPIPESPTRRRALSAVGSSPSSPNSHPFSTFAPSPLSQSSALHKHSEEPASPHHPNPLSKSVDSPNFHDHQSPLWASTLDPATASPSKEKPKPAIVQRQPTFFEYVRDEAFGDYFPGQAEDPLKREEVYNFVHVPLELEKLLVFGFFICFDTFLFLFTFLPVRIVIASGKLIASIFSSKFKLNSAQICDLLRGVIWVICMTVLSFLDPSIIYHFIRGQATIKLYVIFNVLEIFDKLACSFGQDIFDSLYWMSVAVSQSSERNSKKLPPIAHFLVALIYVCFHSIVLFFQAVTLNVAINSHNNSLLTLLVSNQFVELKGSVFKKFEKENLFQISCSDMVERFQLTVFLTIIVVQNLKDLNWDISGHFLWQHGSVVLAVLLSECGVDALKHAFITKFNGIKPEIYQRFANILSRELLATKSRAFTESSWAISKRIGFVPLPLGCLFMRVLTQVLPPLNFVHIIFVIILLLCCCTLKILLRILLLAKSLREFRNSEVIFNPPQLHHVSRFDMVKGKIP